MRILKVCPNKRYLSWDDGEPFWYMGDTAWELFHRLTREEVQEYLDIREDQGFNVIQAVALGEFDGLTAANAYSRLLFILDPEGIPVVKPDDIGESYWKHVDWCIQEMGKRQMFVGLLPTWGDKFNLKWGKGPEIFTPENAYTYGKWIGERYGDYWNVIWILGGDRPLECKRHRDIIDAMAKGIREKDGNHLMTYHPCGETSSVDFVSEKDYIDFHTVQSGHGLGGLESYLLLRRTGEADEKPFMDSEPRYEDHPACFKPEWGCYWNEEDVRQNAYWDMMEGVCGHTYGDHAIWGFNREKTDYFPYTWKEALRHPGAEQMKYVKKLRLSRDFFDFRPAPELISQKELVLGHQCAGRGKDYAYIYTPYGLPIETDLSVMGDGPVRLSWYDPRTGEEIREKILPAKKALLVPPESGKGKDWIAVIDKLQEM